MEPKILLIGRKQEVIDILIGELRKFDRDIVGSNNKDVIKKILENKDIDFVLIGAGLLDDARKEMTSYLHSIRPDLIIHKIQRTEKSRPYRIIEFANEKAVEWKVEQKLGKRPE